MESIYTVVLISVAAEIFEISWQYAPNIAGILANNYRFYSKSIILFLAMHTGYIYTIFVSLWFDILNTPMIAIIALKIFDIFTKLEFIQKIYIKQEIDVVTATLLNKRVPLWLYILQFALYPWLLYEALVW